jgi:hypothetical protein
MSVYDAVLTRLLPDAQPAGDAIPAHAVTHTLPAFYSVITSTSASHVYETGTTPIYALTASSCDNWTFTLTTVSV